MTDTQRVVVPGEIVGLEHESIPGNGTYASEDGKIRACLLGRLVEDTTDNLGKKRVNVLTSSATARELVVDTGDTVLCRVLRMNYNQAFVDILAVGDNSLPFIAKGVIRREDVRTTEIDKVILKEFFRAGDIVQAKVISLGDSKHYFLSTATSGMGVIQPSSLRQKA